MSNTNKIKRPGAGRTKGSFSFVKVPVKTVVEKFGTMPDLMLMLSRKQMEDFGFNNLVTASVGDLKESLVGQSVEPATPVITEEL